MKLIKYSVDVIFDISMKIIFYLTLYEVKRISRFIWHNPS